MSIKDIVEGIGNAFSAVFSAVWGGIKDLFYHLYTSKSGVWILIALLVIILLVWTIGFLDDYAY